MSLKGVKVILVSLVVSFSCGINISDNHNRLSKDYIKQLQENNIIPPNNNYKSRYYSFLPYLYDNGNNDFISIRGDYYSAKHPKYRSINITCGFRKEYGELRNVLKSNIWINSRSKTDFNDLNIQVESSKHGKMRPTLFKRNDSRNPDYNIEYIFHTEIAIDSSSQIIEKVKDDYITITVDGYKYEMLNPEQSFD